jgi:hypothetical protein
MLTIALGINGLSDHDILILLIFVLPDCGYLVLIGTSSIIRFELRFALGLSQEDFY